MNLLRDELGFSARERRFPRKETLAGIYSRTVNAGERLTDVLRQHYPWCLDDLTTLGAGASGPGGRAHTETNVDITDDTLWALLANADVTPIISVSGTPLTYGRTRRLARPILRRVLALEEDEDRPQPLAQGGANRLGNAVARFARLRLALVEGGARREPDLEHAVRLDGHRPRGLEHRRKKLLPGLAKLIQDGGPDIAHPLQPHHRLPAGLAILVLACPIVARGRGTWPRLGRGVIL